MEGNIILEEKSQATSHKKNGKKQLLTQPFLPTLKS